MTRAVLSVAFAYLVALAVALVVGHAAPFEHPISVALAADVAATVVIFGFSVAYRNSSFYDPYWSLAPLPIAVYWLLRPEFPGVNPIRMGAVLALLTLWSLRLTWNWLRGWQGLGHEDWRYLDLQQSSGRAYWLVSFSGIHMAPTFWVFTGCLSLYVSLAAGREPFGPLDLLALAVTGGSIWLEARSDKQLKRYRESGPAPQEFLRSGLWAWSRHPNYLGEMGFWWGLYLFGLAANPSWWWTIAGPLSITLMFRFISLPMIETRMKQRRPGYADYASRSSMLLPRRPQEQPS